jgi:hypothetical protein
MEAKKFPSTLTDVRRVALEIQTLSVYLKNLWEGLEAGLQGKGVQKNFPARVAEVRAKLAPGTPIEVWCQDEMRVGQKNKLTYRWARKGSRPRAIHDQRTQSTYLFGAVCPERGTGAALVLPAASNRIFKSFDDIVDHCCYAWNTLIDQPWKIMSIARRDWASMGYSM